jgi:hypothetical protein
MLDLIYVIGTIAFFAATLVYVRGCDALGRAAPAESERP